MQEVNVAHEEFGLELYLGDGDKDGMTALSRSNSSDADTLLGSEIEKLTVDHLDVEKKAGAIGVVTVHTGRARLLLWMALNTVATISIVSGALASPISKELTLFTGLRKQIHFLHPLLPAHPSRLRQLPPLRDSGHALHPLASRLRDIYPEAC